MMCPFYRQLQADERRSKAHNRFNRQLQADERRSKAQKRFNQPLQADERFLSEDAMHMSWH